MIGKTQKHARFSLQKFFVAILTISAIFLFLALAGSVVLSGYRYQFDIDELFNAQMSYLYAHGYRPHLDVYASVYTPLFFWFAIPIFKLSGFTFDGLYAARYVMIILLAIRLATAAFILRMIFNKRTALLFLPMLLFDPFAVFTAMQFRLDNLMLTLLTVGLLLFTHGVIHRKNKALALSGFFLGFAVVVLTKTVPNVRSVSF